MILEDLFAPSFFARPPIFLPIHNGFYLSKWQVDGSLHKTMNIWYILCTQLCVFPFVLQELTAIVSEEVCMGIQLTPGGRGSGRRLGRNLQVLDLLAALSEHVDPACFSSNQHILQLAQVSIFNIWLVDCIDHVAVLCTCLYSCIWEKISVCLFTLIGWLTWTTCHCLIGSLPELLEVLLLKFIF